MDCKLQNRLDFQPASKQMKKPPPQQNKSKTRTCDGQSRRSLKRRYKKTRQTFPTMDPAHYETQLNIHFEYVEGYIKALKKKNITDEEREKVKKSLFLCKLQTLSQQRERKKNHNPTH
jgi:hypothetical protein